MEVMQGLGGRLRPGSGRSFERRSIVAEAPDDQTVILPMVRKRLEPALAVEHLPAGRTHKCPTAGLRSKRTIQLNFGQATR